MRVLGIDPGTRTVGFGVLDHAAGRFRAVTYGAIRVSNSKSRPMRYREIYEGLVEVITESEPDVVSIENVFCGKSPKSAIRIGEGRGLALLAAATRDLPVHEYDATVVKKAVVGTGRGSKEQVQALVRSLLGLSEIPKPHDAADALAIAICHCHRERIPALR